MSPEPDPLVPPHSADELLDRVLTRGRALRRQHRRRQIGLSLGPLALVLILIAGLVIATRGPRDHADLVQTHPGPTDRSSTSQTAGPDVSLGDLLPPLDLSAGGPGVTNPRLLPSTSSSTRATVARGSRHAPIVVFDQRGADGRYQTAVLRPGAKQAVVVTAPTPERQWPSLSPDGRLIAFSSTQNNLLEGVRSIFELYVVGVDGSGLHQITTSPLDGGPGSQWPSWSPDGSHLVAGCANGTPSPDICTLRPDGSDRRVLASAAGFDLPRWSPDGSTVVVLRGSAPWLLDPSGRLAPRPALSGALSLVAGVPPTFSADGARLLFLEGTGGGSGQPASATVSTGQAGQLVGLPPGRMLISCGAQQVLYATSAAFGPARPGDLLLVGLDGSGATVVLPAAAARSLTPTSCASR